MDKKEFEEISLTCKDGITLFGRRYQSAVAAPSAETEPDFRILCWHGWMDNCRSFSTLVPLLLRDLPGSVDLIALDFYGHGHSSHKSLDGGTVLLMDYVYYVYDVVHQLQWQDKPLTLIGHSMGAAVSLLYAAAFSVHRLVMLDSIGPYLSSPTTTVTKSLRSHCQARLRGKPPLSVYPNLETAVQVRMSTAKAFPGDQYISQAAARELVLGASETTTTTMSSLQFLHDPRIKWPSIVSLTSEQVDQVYQQVAGRMSKTCLLLADHGMPFTPAMIRHVTEQLQPTVVKKNLPGSHHFHLDVDTVEAVAMEIVDFLCSS